MNESGPIISIRGAERTFRLGEVSVPVLRGVDLDVEPGRVTVILGPSGSGKTTLLNLIGGIDRADRGQVRFVGTDLATLSEAQLTQYRRESVGFVFQFYNLIPTLTALENVSVCVELTAEPMDPAAALALVDLSERADHFPAQLSGGEQQRVAIARALAKNPDLLLCDEPTGSLDLVTGRRVLALLDRVARELGTTVIIVTHNSAIARLAHRVVRLGSGVIESIEDHATPVAVEEITW